MFPGPTSRGLLPTRVRGVLTVVLILGSMLAAVVLIFVLPIVSEWLTAGCRASADLPLPLVAQVCSIDFGTVGAAVAVVATMAVAFLAAVAVYVIVPSHGATLRQAFWPALIVGVVIGAFTSLFGWVAPLLVRQWLALGIVGSVFIALMWLNLVFQALIYGAAYARLQSGSRPQVGPVALSAALPWSRARIRVAVVLRSGGRSGPSWTAAARSSGTLLCRPPRVTRRAAGASAVRSAGAEVRSARAEVQQRPEEQRPPAGVPPLAGSEGRWLAPVASPAEAAGPAVAPTPTRHIPAVLRGMGADARAGCSVGPD